MRAKKRIEIEKEDKKKQTMQILSRIKNNTYRHIQSTTELHQDYSLLNILEDCCGEVVAHMDSNNIAVWDRRMNDAE